MLSLLIKQKAKEDAEKAEKLGVPVERATTGIAILDKIISNVRQKEIDMLYAKIGAMKDP